MSKTTKILKILYPGKYDAEHFEHVSNVVIPMVNELILATSEDIMSIKAVHTIPKMAEPLKTADKLDCKIEIPQFKESEKHEIERNWKESQFGQSKHTRLGEDVVITAHSCRINTTWNYLNEFFASLQDETVISGLVSDAFSIKKARTLTNFYSDHPNFSCHIDKRKSGNVLVKDEVTLRQDTNINSDAGDIDAAGYNAQEE